MYRSMIIMGGCAVELTLSSIQQATASGMQAGVLTLLLSSWGAVSIARRLAHSIAGLNLPPSLTSADTTEASGDPASI